MTVPENGFRFINCRPLALPKWWILLQVQVSTWFHDERSGFKIYFTGTWFTQKRFFTSLFNPFLLPISLETSCNNFKRLTNLRRIFHSYGEQLIEFCLGLIIGLIIVLINYWLVEHISFEWVRSNTFNAFVPRLSSIFCKRKHGTKYLRTNQVKFLRGSL